MEYAVPSGYYTLNTKNIKEFGYMAFINFQPKDYFNTKLYTGNGSTNAITGVGFQPDMCLVKSEDQHKDHHYDAVRGANIY